MAPGSSICGASLPKPGKPSRNIPFGQETTPIPGQFPPCDFRAHAPRFTGENFEVNKQKVAQLQEMAKNKGCTASQLALAWVLHQGNDILPLFGTTKQSRLKENIEAADIKLTAAELDWLNKNFPEGAFAGSRYATPQMGMVVH